jgi:hypothetical protein
MWRKLKSKDLLTGLMFVFVGIGAVWLSQDYSMGTARRMGPAYFPSVVGGALAVLGMVVAVRSLWGRSEPVRLPTLRPMLTITGAVVVFALLMRSLGLVLTLFLLIVISCLAGPRYRVPEVAILFLFLAVISTALFIYGLGLQFPLWPN